MRVEEIMNRGIVSARANETIASVATKMNDADVGSVLIADSGTLKGIITDRDIAIRCTSHGHDSKQCSVGHHMTSSVVTVSPSSDILEAAHVMKANKVKRLPVVEDNRLIGILSLADIAKSLERPMHDMLEVMGSARQNW